MKFLCIACDEAMRHTSTAGPDEGSLTVTFSCPACHHRVAMLTNPEWVAAVCETPETLSAVIEESTRWMPTDPAFARFTTRDVELGGLAIPEDSVVHVCFGAANRDPARWDRPDEFDPGRPPRPHLAFGNGPHVCLGMHVARAEIGTAVSTLLARIPGLRLDPDAEPPRIIGMYERGPTAVPAVWQR